MTLSRTVCEFHNSSFQPRNRRRPTLAHTQTQSEWSQDTCSNLKHCKYCGQMKPFNPMAIKYTKASGFHGAKCWDCYLKIAREYVLKWRQPKAAQLNQMEQA